MSWWAPWAVAVRELARSRIARNWSSLVASNLAVQLLAMLATIRIARELAPYGYGEFNLVQAVAMLGMLLAGLGIRQVVIRACAQDPSRTRHLLLAGALLRACACLVVGAAILIYSVTGQQGLTVSFGATAVAAMVGLLAWDLLESVAFGHQHMGFSSALGMVGAVAWVLWAWLVPADWLTPLGVCTAFAALHTARVVLYFGLLKRAGYLRRGAAHAEPGDWRAKLLEPSVPFYWLAILGAAVHQVPILFLAEGAGQAEVGYFNAGFRLIAPLQMMLVSGFTALYPKLAQAAIVAPPRFERMVRGALVGTVALGTAGAILVSAVRQEVVLQLFGSAYAPAADIVVAQCWYSVLLAITTLMGTVLAARERQRQLAILSTAYAVCATPLLWFAAQLGAHGLALGMTLTTALGLSYHWFALQRCLPRRLPSSLGLGLALVVVLGMVFTWGVPQAWAWPLRLLAGACVVLAALGVAALGSAGRWPVPVRVGSTLRIARPIIR
ncbi:MAG TPA: lipopolysaccharide biosynthesis protein [Chloroflexota bacterium]